MNFRTTLVLLCLLIAVGIVVVLTQKHEPASGDAAETNVSGEKLFGVQQNDIVKIAFNDDGGQAITLEKSDFKWSLTSPVKGPADDSAVTAILSAVTAAEARGQTDASPATGVDAPVRKVQISTKNNQTIAFDIGGKSGTGEVAYIRRAGQKQVDVVPNLLADAFDKPLKEFRRAKLLDVGAAEIKQLRVASTQPTMELAKQGENWTMTQPTPEPVDAYAVSDLTSAAANLRADEFVSESDADAAKYGLDQPIMTIDFNTAAPALPPATAPATRSVPTTIKFGRYGDILKKDVYAQISTQPGVFKVTATAMNAFRKSPLELRDKRVVTIDPAAVERIEIVKAMAATTQPTTREASSRTTLLSPAATKATAAAATTQATTIATSGPATTSATQPTSPPTSKWRLTKANDAPADDEKVDALLKEFNPLRVEKYENEADAAPAIDAYTIALTVGGKVETIRLTDAGGTQPFRGEYNGLRFVVSRSLIDTVDGDFVPSATPALSRPSPMMPPEMP